MNTRKSAAVPKPSFEGGGSGLVDQQFLPSDLREELRPLLLEALEPTRADEFLQVCSNIAFVVLKGRRQTTFRDTREQLEAVAEACKALRKALLRLQPDAIEDFEAHEYHPRSGSPSSPVQWTEFVRDTLRATWPRDGLLSCSWDMVAALEDVARHAAEYLPAGDDARTMGPSKLAADSLTQQIVRAYRRMFGSLPPKDQSSWFVAFMQRLGAHFGLATGPRPVRDAVTEEARITSSA